MYCNFHDAYIQFNLFFFDGRRDGAWGPSQFSALMAPNAGPAEPGGPGGHVSPQIWATLQEAKPFLQKAFYHAGL